MKQIYYVIQTLIHGKESIPFKVISLAILESFPIFLTDSLSCPVQDQTRG